MPIRVAIAGLPPLLDDVVRSLLAREHYIEPIGGRTGDGRAGQGSAAAAQVFLTSEEAMMDEDLETLILQNPKLIILVVSRSGRDVSRIRRSGKLDVLGEASPEKIVEVIRDAGHFGRFRAEE